MAKIIPVSQLTLLAPGLQENYNEEQLRILNDFQNESFSSQYSTLSPEQRLVASTLLAPSIRNESIHSQFSVPHINLKSKMTEQKVIDVDAVSMSAPTVNIIENEDDSSETKVRTTPLPRISDNETIDDWMRKIEAEPYEIFYAGINPETKQFEILSADIQKSIPGYCNFRFEIGDNHNILVDLWLADTEIKTGWHRLNSSQRSPIDQNELLSRLCDVFIDEENSFSTKLTNRYTKVAYQILLEAHKEFTSSSMTTRWQEMLELSFSKCGTEIQSLNISSTFRHESLESFIFRNVLMFGRTEFLLIQVGTHDYISVNIDQYEEYADFFPVLVKIKNKAYSEFYIPEINLQKWILITEHRLRNNMIFVKYLRKHLKNVENADNQYIQKFYNLILINEEYKNTYNEIIQIKQNSRQAYKNSNFSIRASVEVLLNASIENFQTSINIPSLHNSVETSFIDACSTLFAQRYFPFFESFKRDENFMDRFGDDGLNAIHTLLSDFCSLQLRETLITYSSALDLGQTRYMYAEKLKILTDHIHQMSGPFSNRNAFENLCHFLGQLYNREIDYDEFCNKSEEILYRAQDQYH